MSSNSRGKRTKAEILDIAWDLISENGADISVARIAAAAGVSRQTIYLHFGSRGGMLVALVRRADEKFEIKEKFEAALLLAEPASRLTATIDAWLDFVPKIYPVAKDLIRLRETDQEASAAWEDRMTDLRRWLLNLMQSLQSDGALAASWTPRRASEFFWAQTSVQAWGLLRKECGWSENAIRERFQESLGEALLVDS
uniref:TetR/AcrR family transcriptional regulator n=1 Tax=uncultured Altererythrobacter sp. TaxID=500840 RepID=UPI002616E643|nr:TetR/AcrR family transcriptional regulator [uncultured Altererythrobacter sp.]